MRKEGEAVTQASQPQASREVTFSCESSDNLLIELHTASQN